LELTVLVDNNTSIDKYFKGEAGLSYYIKEGDTNILFDVGYSDIFISNSQKMDVSIKDVDYLVLSHGHIDHTGGLDSLIKYYSETLKNKEDYPKMIAHPDSFERKYYKDSTSIGINISKGLLNDLFDIQETIEPVWITEKLVYLGEIDRKNDFEAQNPIGYINRIDENSKDYLFDDTALAYKSEEGLVIITGCSHSGICNIVEQAKRVTNIDKVVDIIGGLHLINPDKNKMGKTKKYIKELNLEQLHGCHCTDLLSKAELAEVSNLKQVGVGLKLEYK
jgi:7,8-dihydropterin-6-yl-methyl-4-(beta-D-ribofuranosyl)aminobenzene 5'-phosphate synthase